jgi:hypothetical protein
MENVSDAYYDGSKRFDYSAKYSSQSEVQITLIKKDGTDISVKDFRSCAKWLTGARTNTWLDMCVGDKVIYSFLGKFLNLEQYKFDARTTGIRLTFSSISPWAYSAPQNVDGYIKQSVNKITNGIVLKFKDGVTYFSEVGSVLYIDDYGNYMDVAYNDNILAMSSDSEYISLYYKDETLYIADSFEYEKFGFSNGVLSAHSVDKNSYFLTNDDGVVFLDDTYQTIIDNQSDDLYTYIYLDICYQNEQGNSVYIKNVTLEEESKITDLTDNEYITISANQFITSSIPYKIFGNSFNFVWPRLQPGKNNFIVSCGGNGRITFTYRYPMKIGDCVMDIDANGNGIICDSYLDGENEVFAGTVAWDKITGKPTTLKGYGITDAYTIDEVDYIIDNIEVGDGIAGGGTKIDEEELNKMLDDILG